MTPLGVLLMAHGTPARSEDLPAFYTEIRRGRPPPPELLDELAGRYSAIGGLSPLAAISEAQRAGVAAALARRSPVPTEVVLGTRFAEPRIETAVAELVAAGCHRAVGVVLAPHSSVVSVGEYRRRAAAAAGDDLALTVVDRWHLAPGLVALLADRVRAAVAGLGAGHRTGGDPGGDGAGSRDGAGSGDGAGDRPPLVLYTAHSVPQRVVDAGDDYPEQVRATAAAVAAATGLPADVAFQSAGRTGEPWLGPDLLDRIRQAASDGERGVVVCPVGFVADHLEVLYDLDVEAAALAGSVGLPFARTASCNDDPAFCDVVAGVALAALGTRTAAGDG